MYEMFDQTFFFRLLIFSKHSSPKCKPVVMARNAAHCSWLFHRLLSLLTTFIVLKKAKSP